MLIQCPRCLHTSDSENWNKETSYQYGNSSITIEEAHEIKKLDEYWFCCPSCHQKGISGDKLILT